MSSNVDRFLADAEKCARNGERELAYSLLELALLNAPNDPRVLARVEEIRSLISPGVLRKEVARSAELPDLPVFAPKASEDRAVEFDDDGYDEYSDWRAEPNVALSARETWPEEEAPSNLKGRITSLVLLLVTLLAAGAYVARPQEVVNLISYRQLVHPVDKAVGLRLAGNTDAALAELRRVGPTDDRLVEALLLRAEILSSGDDEVAAEQAWQEVVSHPGVTWNELLKAARWYYEKGRRDARDIYLLAFERGAPAQHWLEIAKVQSSQGNVRAAIAILQLIVRKFAPDSAAAALELRNLQKAGM